MSQRSTISTLRRSTSLSVMWCLIVGLSSCRQNSQLSGAVSNPTQSTDAKLETDEEKSCRAVVQEFYDWYINGHSKEDDGEPAWYQVAKQKPYLLSDQLRKLLNRASDERDRAHALGEPYFDAFLAFQDSSKDYKVKAATVQGDHCDAQVTGSVNLRKIELINTRSSWVIDNAHYSSDTTDGKTNNFPDYDLVHLFSRGQKQQKKAKTQDAQK